MQRIPVRQIKDSFFEEKFSVRKVESLTEGKDLIHELHRHDFYFVLFTKNGSGDHEIDFIKYKVDNHSVFFVRPGQVHQLNLRKGSTGYILQFTTDFYAPKELPSVQVLKKVSSKSHCHLSTARFEKIEWLLQNVFVEFNQKEDRYKEVVKASLELIFVELVRQSSHPNKIASDTNLYDQRRLEEFQDLLDKYFDSKKQVSDYADMMALTNFQLNAITKSNLQKTVSALINERIILEAKRLLIASASQVNQVADMLGYDDPSYFIRFFKKQTGLTPDSFRQNFK